MQETLTVPHVQKHSAQSSGSSACTTAQGTGTRQKLQPGLTMSSKTLTPLKGTEPFPGQSWRWTQTLPWSIRVCNAPITDGASLGQILPVVACSYREQPSPWIFDPAEHPHLCTTWKHAVSRDGAS